ncbi:MAG: cache domain-containing protein [Campylobacterota bacterium]
MLKDKELSKLIYIVPITIVTISILIITIFNLETIYDRFENNYTKQKKEFIKKEQDRLTTIVDSIDSYIKFKKATSINILKSEVEKNFNFVYKQLHKPKYKKLENQLAFLSKIDSSFRGNFYIYSYKNRKAIDKVQPKSNSFIYSNVGFIEKFNELVKNRTEGFILFNENKSSSKEQKRIELAYIKNFKDKNRILIYKMSLDNIQHITKSEVLSRLNLMQISNKTAIFTLDENLKFIQKTNKNIKLDDNLLKIVKTYQDKSKLKIRNKSYKYYFDNNINKKNSYKLYIFDYIDYWDYIIGVSLEIEDFDSKLKQKIQKELKLKKELITNAVLVSLFVWILAAIASIFMSYKLNQIFKKYRFRIENQNNALKNINASLKTKLKKNN